MSFLKQHSTTDVTHLSSWGRDVFAMTRINGLVNFSKFVLNLKVIRRDFQSLIWSIHWFPVMWLFSERISSKGSVELFYSMKCTDWMLSSRCFLFSSRWKSAVFGTWYIAVMNGMNFLGGVPPIERLLFITPCLFIQGFTLIPVLIWHLVYLNSHLPPYKALVCFYLVILHISLWEIRIKGSWCHALLFLCLVIVEK